MKTTTISKKTHAYIIDNDVIVRAVSEVNAQEYIKEGKTVYADKGTKTIDGVKTNVTLYFVNINDFVKRSTARTTVASKLSTIAASGVDLKKMTAAELVAMLQA